MANFLDGFRGVLTKTAGGVYGAPGRERDDYLSALEKAAYNDAGAKYGQGLSQITNYLAGAGPLADSGASTALRYKLASQVYGGAKSRIGNSYADFIRAQIEQKRQYQYQKALMEYQKKLNKKGPLDYLAGAAGGVLGQVGGGGAKGAVQTYGASPYNPVGGDPGYQYVQYGL